MSKKTVAIIFGGVSSEYSVSLMSACSVINNTDSEKYDKVLIGITEAGEWYRYTGDTERILNDGWWQDDSLLTPVTVAVSRSVHGFLEYKNGTCSPLYVDCALPILHGKNGEDGTVQGMLELAGIPVAGCGSLGSCLCMNKHLTQKLAETVGVPVPRSLVLYEGDSMTAARIFADGVGYPVFVKPVKTGSSYGVTKVERAVDLAAAIDTAFRYDDTVMVEEAVVGREISCAVMGNKELVVGEVDETEVKDGFYDFAAKYAPKSTVIHLPARLNVAERERVKDIAKRLYRATGCNGFARVDLFYTDKGEVIFGEINTIPGFTEHSHFPKMMGAAGYSFPQIIEYFIENC